jgi:DNA invertase Pin-like site-specific DNA recombinase
MQNIPERRFDIMIYGYARVSHKDQNLDRQLEQLREVVPDQRNIITDMASGKDFDRQGWHLLVGSDTNAPLLREGDQLIVLSLDRLGRNYAEIRREWQHITQDLGADIRVLDMPLLNTACTEQSLDRQFIADLVLQILSYVAEKERQNIRERQRQGIELAKTAGKYKGRKPKEIDEDLLRAECVKWRSGKQTAVQTFRNCGLSKAMFYRKVKAIGL